MRHEIIADGISYLDIASYYARGDWHSALNGYWSPLYSWAVAALMLVFRPDPYWNVSLLHIVNFLAYLASLAGFEAILTDLLHLQRRLAGSGGFSEPTIRIVGYSVFLVASLMLISIGYTSPDMLGMSIMFYLLHVLLQIEAGKARTSTYLLFGAALALEYLCRAAFAPFIGLYVVVAGALLWRRHQPLLRPLAYTVLIALLVASPFVVALSLSKGRFTLGDAGKLNYGWEIDGAARSTHWQGEPYDIGKPIHPTHKVLDHPATYTFASPVPGTYPPWYDPSYWYEGIRPRVKIGPQVRNFFWDLAGAVYLFLRSPVTIPALMLVFFMGWRNWLSKRGILGYWFLLLPTTLYIFVYLLVYLDSRYIAGSLLVIWMCLLVSISIPGNVLRAVANRALQFLGLAFALGFAAARLVQPVRTTAADLVHLRESEWNINWMLANRLKQLGVTSKDKVGWIGLSVDAEWTSIMGLKVVAEVPMIYDHESNTLFRRVVLNQSEINAFWSSTPEQKAKVYQAFRTAGATVVVADEVPDGADPTGWQRVLPAGTPHVTRNSEGYKGLCLRRLAPPPTD